MKKLIVLAILVSLGLQAQAQIVSSRSSMVSVSRDKVSRNYHGWSTIGVEYLPTTIKNKYVSESLTGLALNFTNAISVTQSAPLFVEWGIGGQYTFKNGAEPLFYGYDDVDIDCSYKVVSVKAPINIIYEIEIPNSTVKLDPFVGVKFRYNVWGQAKMKYQYKDYGYGAWSTTYEESKSYDLFKSNEGGCNRFQVGMQVGLKAKFNDIFFVGFGYGFDFSKFNDKTDAKVKEFKIMAGLVL